MSAAENIERLLKKVFAKEKSLITTDKEMDKKVLNDSMAAYEQTKNTGSEKAKPSVRRMIMKRPIIKLAAAVILIAAVISINLWNASIPKASAAEVLADAVKAVSNISSVHIKGIMRTLPQDNFASIGLYYDFVSLEMWKSIDEYGNLKWRIEKPLRTAVMDGEMATLLIRDKFADSGRCPDFQCYDLYWCGQLLNVEALLETALKQAQENTDSDICMWHETIDGRDKIVIDIEKKAVGGFENDYLKNKFLFTADTKTVYTFDSETKLLEAYSIYVHTDGEDVLIFEITDMEYNSELEESLFVLEPGDDVIWLDDAVILPDDEKYEQMGPKETAEVFFQACADEEWEEAVKFNTLLADEEFQEMFGGLEIISIGEPFQSGFSTKTWFVPYEIKLKNGQVRKHNLALKKDKQANRYFIDGGL
jgi:outer membrane lipoprotein-sorting protein